MHTTFSITFKHDLRGRSELDNKHTDKWLSVTSLCVEKKRWKISQKPSKILTSGNRGGINVDTWKCFEKKKQKKSPVNETKRRAVSRCLQQMFRNSHFIFSVTIFLFVCCLRIKCWDSHTFSAVQFSHFSIKESQIVFVYCFTFLDYILKLFNQHFGSVMMQKHIFKKLILYAYLLHEVSDIRPQTPVTFEHSECNECFIKLHTV